MKRIVVCLICLFAACSLAACGGGDEGTQSDGADQVGQAQPSEPTADNQGQGQGEQADSQGFLLKPAYAADFSDTLLVGDSVMHLCDGAIWEKMPASVRNTSSGRTMEEGGPNENYSPDNGILDVIRADGGNGFERYVIGAASNEVEGMSYEMGAEIINILHGKPVWFITQMVTNNSNSTANTNAAIEALCADYPQAHKIDWYQACVEHPEYLGDNAHASEEGARVYADLVYTALTQ